MRTSVATLIVFVCLAQIGNAQQFADPGTIYGNQQPYLMSQGTGPNSALTPGYPRPAPPNLQPEIIDNNSPWSAFSPPTAPIPPGANFSSPGLQAPSLGVPNGTYADPYAQQPSVQNFGNPAFNQQYGTPLTQAFQPVNQFGQDPFLSPQQGGVPGNFGLPQQGGGSGNFGLPQAFTTPGANGPQPYRFGWQQRLKTHWISDQSVSGGSGPARGDFGVFGLDYELQWTQQMPGWVFITVPHFGLRLYDGPGDVSFPSDVYRFGYEFRLETPKTVGPFSLMLSVTPSLNTDLERSPTSDAWNLDAKGAVIFQIDQYWQAVLGLQYWDRVNDEILPYGGLIYTDDFWEWQLTFPEARISLFLGSEFRWAKWLYVRGEYHVESYEIDTNFGGGNLQDQVELEDWRILAGLKMDTGYYDWFFEGGVVFDREVNFRRSDQDFDIGSGFIGQIGLRF